MDDLVGELIEEADRDDGGKLHVLRARGISSGARDQRSEDHSVGVCAP